MYAHHQETIQRTIEYFKTQPEVRALLLGGSIAHGFAKESSDVDIMIIVSDEEYDERLATNKTAYSTRELATYPEGYIDAKYVSEKFMSLVEQKGSEPARFAFADAQVLFSHIEGLEARLQRLTRYPVEEKVTRIKRFYAQFQAWHWYTTEGDKKQNSYLMATSVSKLTLFGGRMILAHNEMLYPFHKWFLAVLDRAQDKPANLVPMIQAVTAAPTRERITEFYETILNFRTWEKDEYSWSNRFLEDTELTWMNDKVVVDDI